jgi:hypothetical protein
MPPPHRHYEKSDSQIIYQLISAQPGRNFSSFISPAALVLMQCGCSGCSDSAVFFDDRVNLRAAESFIGGGSD